MNIFFVSKKYRTVTPKYRTEPGILCPPSFITFPVNQTGISGGVASFVCQARGEPKPRITWFKIGKKVIEFDGGLGSVLRIQPLRVYRDAAIYKCIASNSAGEVNVSARLEVLEGKNGSCFFF
uniref:Ig-like domain-containing protein n=1 Tax=Maylandia zebra TaxID=106582 RepID=A0A3P9DUP7_9CICH